MNNGEGGEFILHYLVLVNILYFNGAMHLYYDILPLLGHNEKYNLRLHLRIVSKYSEKIWI